MRSCARVAFLLLAIALPLSGWAAQEEVPARFEDPEQQQRYENLIRQVRCLVCQNESIADSNAPLAADLRREIRGMMHQGASDEEILAFLTARYGDFVLYRPPFQPNTWLLWLAPALLVLIGGSVFAKVIAARASKPMDEDEELEDETGEGGRA